MKDWREPLLVKIIDLRIRPALANVGQQPRHSAADAPPVPSLERPEIFSARTSEQREMNPALKIETALVGRGRASQFLRLRSGGVELLQQP
jgi:hypothetical protein